MAYKNNDLTSHIRSVAAQNANAIRSSATEDELNSIVDDIIADGNRGYVDRFASNFKGGAAGVGSGLAQFVGANDTAESLNKVVKNNTNRRQYNSIFDEGYLTDPQGLVSTIGNQLGSMAALLPFGVAAEAVLPTAAIGAGAAGLLTGSLARLGAKNISTKLAEKLAGEGVKAFAKRATQGALSGVAESASEGGNVEKELLDDGKNPGYAAEKGREVFAKNLPFLMASNAVEYLALSGKLSNPGAKATEGMGTRALKAPMRMAPDALANAIQNGYEEVFQQTFSDEALGHPTGTPWDHTSWTPGQRQAFEMGFAGSGAIGAGTGMYHGMRVQKKDQKKNDNPPTNNQQATAKQMSEAAGQAAVQQVAQEVVANNAPQQQSQETDAGFESFFNSIAQQESDGDYNAVGKPVDESGDYAIGKYQIMKSNWPSWAQEAGLPADAEPTPENQDIVARTKMKQYYDKYGARGAALAWYGGEGALNYSAEALNKRQTSADGTVFPSLNDYADQVTGRAGVEGIDMGSATSSATQATAPKAQEAEQTYEDMYNEVLRYADTLPVSTEAELAVANPIYETLDSGDKNAITALAEKLGLKRGNEQAGENLQAEEQTQPQASLEAISPMHNEENDGEAVPGREIVKPAPTVQPQVKAIVTDKRVAHLEKQQAAITQRPAGKTVTSTTDANNMAKFPTQYRLVEASDLTTSNNPDDFSTNELYPAELQPKSRDTAPLAGQVMNIAGKGTMEPMLLVNRDININSGAPLINEFGIVENGNGRSMGITRAYKAGEAGRKYKAYLAENAEDFGFTREQVEGMQQPVLVRQRMSDDVDLQKIISANAGGASMSASDQAKVDAKAISAKTLGLYQPNITNGIYAKNNMEFMANALADITHGNSGEVNKLVTGQNMTPSDDGYKRVKDATFALAYQDDMLLAKMSEERSDANIISVLDAMEKAAPYFARIQSLMADGTLHEYNIAKPIVDAAKKLMALRREGKPVATFLAEQQLLGDELSDEARNMLRAFDEGKYAKQRIFELLLEVGKAVEAIGPTNQESIFGDVPLPTLGEVFGAALKLPLKEMKGDEKGLFKEKPASTVEEHNNQDAKLGQAEKPAKQQAERMGGDGQNATVGSSEAPQSDGQNQGIANRDVIAEGLAKIGLKDGSDIALERNGFIQYGKAEKWGAQSWSLTFSYEERDGVLRKVQAGQTFTVSDLRNLKPVKLTDVAKRFKKQQATNVKEKAQAKPAIGDALLSKIKHFASLVPALEEANAIETFTKVAKEEGEAEANKRLDRIIASLEQQQAKPAEEKVVVADKVKERIDAKIAKLASLNEDTTAEEIRREFDETVEEDGLQVAELDLDTAIKDLEEYQAAHAKKAKTTTKMAEPKKAEQQQHAPLPLGAMKNIKRMFDGLKEKLLNSEIIQNKNGLIYILYDGDKDFYERKTLFPGGHMTNGIWTYKDYNGIKNRVRAIFPKDKQNKELKKMGDMYLDANDLTVIDNTAIEPFIKEYISEKDIGGMTDKELAHYGYKRNPLSSKTEKQAEPKTSAPAEGKVFSDKDEAAKKLLKTLGLKNKKSGITNKKGEAIRIVDSSPEAKAAYLKTIKEETQGKLSANPIFNPKLLTAYFQYGAAVLQDHANDFIGWAKQMIEEVGEAVRPWLGNIWKSVHAYAENAEDGEIDADALQAAVDFVGSQYEDGVKTEDGIVNAFAEYAGTEAAEQYRPLINAALAGINEFYHPTLQTAENQVAEGSIDKAFAEKRLHDKNYVSLKVNDKEAIHGRLHKDGKDKWRLSPTVLEKDNVFKYADVHKPDIDFSFEDVQRVELSDFNRTLDLAKKHMETSLKGGTEDVHNGGTENTKRDSAGNNQDAVGQDNGRTITDGSGTDSNGQAESGRSTDDGEGGLHSRSAATGGEIGDSGVQSEASGSIEDSAGSADLPADSRANLEGLSAIDDGRSGADVKTAQDGRNNGAASNEKLNKEILKELSRYDANFIESIQKDLPFLTTGQTLDVAFAEKRLFDNHGQGVMFTNGTGTGKAQPLDAKILTPHGWTTMGEIQVGDDVISVDGTPTKVLAVYPKGEKDIYKVEFSDGSSTECCNEHLWETQTLYERRKATTNPSWDCAKPKVRTLDEIIATIDKQHFIPIVKPIDFNNSVNIDGYVLGVILGDGCVRGKTVTISNPNEEIITRIKNALPADYNVKEIATSQHKCNTYRITSNLPAPKSVKGCFEKSTFIAELERLGVMDCLSIDKFIPNEYLQADLKTRTSLLQGLLDTDGTIDKRSGVVSYSTSSKQLSEDFVALVQSLGGVARSSTKQPIYTHNGGKLSGHENYVISVNLPAEIKPFLLSTKAQYLKPKKYYPKRKIVKITYVGKKKAQCILVDDARHLYVTDDYIVTHNTFTGLGVAKRLVDAGKKNILVVTPSQDINAQWQSAAEKFFGMNISVLKDTQDAGEGMVITTYANFQANNQLSHREWDMVIADEAHNLMSSENGDMTSNLLNLRALTYHKAGFRERAHRLLETPEMREIDKEMKRIEADIDELEQLGDIKKMTPKVRNKELPKISTTEALQRIEAKEAQKERLKKKLEKMWEALEPEIQRLTEEWGKILPADKPKVVFLSATPFNYVFNIDYAEGYLFDFAEPKRQGGYNQPNARGKFYMDNFAYRMRTGKLTKPEGNVQNRILEVQFHEKLKKEGVLSDHVLDVDVDYDRGFIVVEDPNAQDGKGIGEKIDEGFEWLRETQKGRYRELYDALSEQYTAKQRNYLLESIKARGSISLIQKYLESGKKVVVYHQRKKEQELRHPFILDIEKVPRDEHYDNVLWLYRQFKENRPDLLALNFRDLKTPIETYQEAFGEDVMIYNGDTRPKKKAEYIKAFNTDHNNRNLLVVQVDAGNAGISLHDTTGEHQRVLINISIPPRPSYAMQIEGRIFRFGSVSNAIFRYLSTGTTLEKTLFANTLAGKVSTAENLGMGVQARNLRDSFVNLYSETLDGTWRNKLPGADGEGTGGKAADNALDVALSEFERAKTFYYANQKKTARTKSAEGVDYYATPEPLGYKMVEWLNAKLDNSLLEPSAGHGAISRFFTEDTFNTIVEPSAELLPVAQLHTVNAKVVAERFEDFNIINKFDGIAMNPPYGVGGKTAMEHVEKAFKQLRNGGRLIAIVPNGPSMDKRLENFAESKEAKHIYKVAEIILPSSTFGRAGTNVNTKLLVFDKYEDEKIAEKFQTSMYIDLSNAKSNEELFNRIENLSMPDRIKISTDAESNPEGRPTKQGSKHGIIGVSADIFIHTKTRAEIPSAKLVTDSFDPEGFAMLKEIAKKYDGYWDHRFANAFLFKSLDGRNQFVAEGDKAVSDRYRQSMKNGDDTQYSVQDNLANAVLSEAQWEKAIKDAFKGLSVSRIDGTHFAVQLPSGNQVYVETGAKISFTSVDKERAEQALGRKLLPNERPVGFTKTVDGARVIGLADGATAQTVDHEAFHVAMAMALNKQEYLAMLKRYRNTDGSFNEEQAADDYAAFASKKRQITGLFAKLFEKIKYFIAKAKMKLGFGGASDVFRAVKNGDVWQKTANGNASMAYKIEHQAGSETTQIAGTRSMYAKTIRYIADKVNPNARNVLDYGAGLGLGSDAMREARPNLLIDSYEPDPTRWKGKLPPTYTNSDDITKKYDVVVSTNVVNVLEPQIRQMVVSDIADKLTPGGTALITSRGWKQDIGLTKNFEMADEEKAMWVIKGQERVYQKGFDGNELLDYVQGVVGEGYTVKKINGFGKTAVLLTKNTVNSKTSPEATDIKFSIQQATETLAENVGATEKGTIEVMEKAKAPDVDLTDAIVTSPWRIAQRVPGFRMIHKWATSAMNLQEKLRSNYRRKLSAALKIVNSKKLKEDLYSLLWRGDLEAKEWTREELVEEGFDENVIESYMQVRRLIKTAYTKMNEARKHVKTYSKNMSASQLETLKANKFVEILGEPQETGNDNYIVTWKEPQNWLKHYSGIDAATYARFLNSPDIQILTTADYADLDGNTVYDLDVRERIGDINERTGYIPHFFHDFFIMEKKTDEEGNDTYKVLGPVGSAKTLKQAYKIAQEYQKKNPAMNIVIKPKEFHLDKEAEQAIVIGDMDYEKVTQRLAKDNEMAITEVKEMLDGNIRLKGRHRFFGNLLERKGVDGYERDMEWVLRHYFNGVSRYIALESEFKPKAISMFERVYGAFDKEYTGTAKYVKDFINDINGNPSSLEQLINNKLNNNELWRKHVASHFGDRAALQLAGSITNNVSVLKLGLFNVSSALLNLTQLINAAGILGSVPAVFDGIQRLTHLTMRDRGVLVATGVVNDIGMDSGSGYTKLTVGKLKNSTMFLFKKSEQLCRYGTVLAAYHKAVAEGKTHKQAIDYAKIVNRRANFDYSVADAPNVFRRGSIIAQIVLQFKKYPVKQFELMKDMLSDRTDYKQKAIFWGGYFLLSGLLQVPVIDWFDDLVKGFTGDSKKLSAKKAMMEFAGDDPQLKALVNWAMYGAGSTIGVDFSNRTGMANVIPQKLDKYTLGGPAFSTIYGFLVNMYQNEPLAAAKAFSPGVANIMQVAVGHSEGKRGRVDTVYDTVHEKTAKLLGFNTVEGSVGSDFKKIINQAENQKTKARQKAMDAYIANPTQENWKEMKALGVTPRQVRAERKNKMTPTTERAKKDINRKDRKNYRDLLKYLDS